MAVDPYRPLFLLGITCGVVGVSLWLLFTAGQIAYPIQLHSGLMISGMFLSFVSGFLMTALPRMSGTHPATTSEVFLALSIVSGSMLLALFGFPGPAGVFTMIQILFLTIFAGRRFLKRSQNPPVGFMFIPVGLLWCLLGSSLSALAGFGVSLAPELEALRRVALQQAFLLNLIVGLGSRLIPLLCRVTVIEPFQQKLKSMRTSLFILLGLNLIFLLEVWLTISQASLLLFFILGFVAIHFFKILKPSQQRTYLGIGLRLAVGGILSGFLLLSVLPQYQLALLHIIFISGYSLLTLMIATRVVLAHGGVGTQREVDSWALPLVILLLLLASVLRVLYILPWAAAIWIFAVGIWFCGVGRFLTIRPD